MNRGEGPFGKADLQIHTSVSDGMADPHQLLDYVEEKTDLTAIAVTDHDSIRGGLMAHELWANGRYSFDVIVGNEVTTQDGHLLALYIHEPVPSLLSVQETLEAIHRQGGLAVIPHPLSWMTRSLGPRAIASVVQNPTELVYFDGIELANDTFAARLTRKRARRLNEDVYHLAETGGSDAHFLEAVGSAHTAFVGSTAEDLRAAILEKTTVAVNGRHPSVLTIGPRLMAKQAYRGITATPRALGWRRTARSFVKLFLRI
jgi:predicted metal-dependent phosphoesterase TrpH